MARGAATGVRAGGVAPCLMSRAGVLSVPRGAAKLRAAVRVRALCPSGSRHVARSAPRTSQRRGRGAAQWEVSSPRDTQRGDYAACSCSTSEPVELEGAKLDAEIFSLALPAMFAVLLDPLMSIIDTAIIGRLGVNELAGTGIAGLLWTIFSVGVFQFLAVGITPLVAAPHSKGESGSVSRTIAAGLWLAAGLATVVLCLKFVGAEWMVTKVFKTSGAVSTHAMAYLNGRIWSIHATLMQLVCIGALRGMKDTRTILVAAGVSNALNVCLDCLFVFSFGMGVRGAAISSTISSTLSFAILLFSLARRANPAAEEPTSRGSLRLGDLMCVPQWVSFKPILEAGLALSAKSLVTMYTLGLVSKSLVRLGPSTLAAHEILKQMFFICYIGIEPLSIACQSLVANAIGHGSASEAGRVLRRLVQLASGLGLGLCLALLAFGPALVGLFTKDTAVKASIGAALPLVALFQPLDAVMLVQEGALLGARQHAYISKAVAATSLVCLAVLLGVVNSGVPYQIVTVWAVVKILTIGRITTSTARLYFSPKSPIKAQASASVA